MVTRDYVSPRALVQYPRFVRIFRFTFEQFKHQLLNVGCAFCWQNIYLSSAGKYVCTSGAIAILNFVSKFSSSLDSSNVATTTGFVLRVTVRTKQPQIPRRIVE